MSIHVVFFDLGRTLVNGDRSWITGAQNVIAVLRNRGVKLGIISDTGDRTRSEILQLLPSDFDLQLFEPDLILFSSEVGVTKPQLGIFLEAVRRAGIPPTQCLFCSEDFEHVIAAQRALIVGARVQPPPNSDIVDLVQALTNLSLI